MKRSVLAALSVALPLPLLASFALPLTAPAAAYAADESPIAEQMEIISAGMKQLRRALREEGQQEQCLTILAEIEKAALYAKVLTPPMAESLPEGDRPKFVADFRKTMVELITKMLALETALIDGETEAITAAFQALRAMEDSGHERFTEDG